MVVLKFRTSAGATDVMKKLKKMHKFTKELIECIEDQYEDDDEYDDEVDYRREDEMTHPSYRGGGARRYRRSM